MSKVRNALVDVIRAVDLCGFKRGDTIELKRRVAERFKRITAPFMMRRLKTVRTIISDLPEKISVDEYCVLTKEQAAIYNEVVRRGMMEIENCKDNHFVRHALVLRMLVQLKQICDAPALFEPSAGF